MNISILYKQRLVRSIAGTLFVLAYGVIMAITVMHAITQADLVTQPTWEPMRNAAVPRPANVNMAERHEMALPLCPIMLGVNPIDGAQLPGPHTGECIDDCSTNLACESPSQMSM